MDEQYVGCLFDLAILPNNRIRLSCPGKVDLYFALPNDISFNSDTLLIQFEPDGPVHKFIEMFGQWNYMGLYTSDFKKGDTND